MRKSKIKVSRGFEKADIVLKKGNVLNVFTEEFMVSDVAIVDDTIVGIGEYDGDIEIDCEGKFLVPGFIDAHVHIESSMVTPLEFSKEIVRFGTTTIIADPHEIVNVAGAAGMDFILDSSNNIPISVYVMIPSSVPATDIDTNGAGKFLAKDMLVYKSNSRVLGLGEMMRFVDVLEEHGETMEKLEKFSDMIIDGHAPGLMGKDVQAYRLSGVRNDHECATEEEAIEKLRAGFYLLIREGSGAKNLETIVSALVKSEVPLERCMFCTDDKHLDDIEKEGHINYCVRKAIALGIPPEKAYKMASYYPAVAYGLKDRGAIGAGYKADILIVDNKEDSKISKVIKNGIEITDKVLSDYSYKIKDKKLLETVICDIPTKKQLELKLKRKNHFIELIPHQLLTKHKEETLPGKDFFEANEEYIKLCVIERHGKNRRVGICPIKGFGLKEGAIATTVSHDSHNIIVAGVNDEDIILAIKELKRIQGGYVITSKGKVLDSLQLQIGGLMSLDSSEVVKNKTNKMVELARKMGVKDGIDPFITLSFMALTVIPEIRLTESGIYDVNNLKFIN